MWKTKGKKNSALCDHDSVYFYIIVIQDDAPEDSETEEHQTGSGFSSDECEILNNQVATQLKDGEENAEVEVRIYVNFTGKEQYVHCVVTIKNILYYCNPE